MKAKSRIKQADGCARIFEIEVHKDDVDRAVAEVYEEIRKVAKIPGYRPGTAPRDLLEKYHSKDVREEVLKRVIPESYNMALDEHEVSPVSLPEISDIIFEEGKPFSFKARVEMRPKIKLPNYKGLKVRANRVKVEEKEVESAIARLQAMNAKYTTIEGKPVKKGDYVVCDIEAFSEGKPISRKNENLWVTADKDISMLGLGEQLIGMEPGQSKDIETRLPKDYPDKKFSDKPATFKVLVKEIKERRLPPVDDELAKDMGKESLSSLREEIVKAVLSRKEQDEVVSQENQVLDQLLKSCRFDVPASMVERQYRVLEKRLEDDLLSRGVNKDAVGEKKKEFSKQLMKDAENKIRVYFILDEISAKEGIKADDKDMESRFAEIAGSTNQTKESVKDYYAKHDLLEGLAEQVREEKTLKWLLDNAERS